MGTHIFYAPHTDDEALGMGGAMAQARLDGHDVRLVLLTDNRPSTRARALFAGRIRCPVHGEAHEMPDVDLATVRWQEFTRAAATLGITELERYDFPESMTGAALTQRIAELLLAQAARHQGAVHHLVSGIRDTYGGGLMTPAHAACASAVSIVRAELVEVLLHRVYVYALPLERRTADRVVLLTPEALAAKREALAAYCAWDPPAQVAYGLHSVPELFHAAATDPREYVDVEP